MAKEIEHCDVIYAWSHVYILDIFNKIEFEALRLITRATTGTSITK
jgi:hypothetical protein